MFQDQLAVLIKDFADKTETELKKELIELDEIRLTKNAGSVVQSISFV